MPSGIRSLAAITVLLVLSILSLPAHAGSTSEMLEKKALVNAYNPELLDFLLQEGKDSLPADQRKVALDQLVSGLKQDIEITPEEQKAAALAAAAAGMAQLFGGSDVNDLGNVAQDATYQIWRGWVDSAFTLQRAGYAEESNAFFEKCIEIFPYSDLRGRCAIGLAAGHPNEAYERLMALTEANDTGTINAALRQVGVLAGSDGFPADLRSAAIQRLIEFTGGIKKASYGEAACYGMVATGDPQVVPTLEKLSKGMMNTAFFPCSRRGLLMTFNDRSVVPALEKQLKGGSFSTTKPHEKLFAASLLMDAGEASGFAFVNAELTKKKKKGFGKFMDTSSDDVDLRPSLVRAAVRVGGEDAKRVLKNGLAAAKKGSWLETWIAVGLLELGDTSQIPLAKSALGNPEWAFTTVRIATALAKLGDYSGIPALEKLYADAAKGIAPETGKAVLAFLAGEGTQYGNDRESRERRLIHLRQQAARALADIDQPQCVPLLITILGDEEASVRIAAAYALARMQTTEAAQGLAVAMKTDFGALNNRSRSPVVQAHVARAAAARFANVKATEEVLAVGRESSFPSVAFLSLCAKKP